MKFFRKKNNQEIDPDEIFLDSRNLPDFDVNQFEGRIEKPIAKSAGSILFISSALILCAFFFQLGNLQVAQGENFRARSEDNRLHHQILFSERGIIEDRNGVPLAWNDVGEDFSSRAYIDTPGFAHVLGYVSYPQKDTYGVYFQEQFIGKDGIERVYDSVLSGKQGRNITEVDVFGNIISQSEIETPENGKSVTLSLDAKVQGKLHESIKNLVSERGFVGGAGGIMDVKTGEILALSSFPEYDSEILSSGKDRAIISRLVTDTRKPFLNRFTSGLYSPGSTVKLFISLAALHEKIISPEKSILSTGAIEIPNPYVPGEVSIFRDWKAHGWVDMRKAIAVSSNVYFYAIGGGFEDQKGLGITKIAEYIREFGIERGTGIDLPTEEKGTVPDPLWKEKLFDGDPWRLGDTYHTSIGQYGFEVTPIEMLVALSSIANGGELIRPRLASKVGEEFTQKEVKGTLPFNEEEYRVVREGMRESVRTGTAAGLSIPNVSVAAKTGTSEVGVLKDKVNSWVVGFFPAEKPRYAFVVVMERGPRANTVGALFIMRQLLDWMSLYTPEYTRSE